MAKNLIRSCCKGMGKRFNRLPCEYYIHATGECTLLREAVLSAVFEKGRCEPFSILQRAVKKQAQNSKMAVALEKQIEPLAVKLLSQIQSTRLAGEFSIYALKSHISKAAYIGIANMVWQKNSSENKQCGDCKHLSRENPYICQRTTITTEEEGEIENPFYGSVRRLTKHACKEGFEPAEPDSTDFIPEYPGMLIADMANMLRERIARTEDKKERHRYTRQYVIFCRFIDILKRSHARQKELIRMMIVSPGGDAAMFEHELTDIREFFKKQDIF